MTNYYLDEILADHKNVRTLVGVRGVTGSGKSTMINALLRMKDLLPSQNHKACTAVPVEVAYNDSNDPAQKFRAVVEFASYDDWKKELSLLFSDLATLSKDAGDGTTEEDLECKERITDALSKLKYVYPELKTIEDLGKTSAARLLNHKNVVDILGSSKEITHDDQRRFQEQISLYIATQEAQKKSFAHWPLVQLVKVFVKSRILESGIVLVDLPGSADSNAARGAVAANYQKNLAITCMVFDARRGVDDQNVSSPSVIYNEAND